MMTGSLEYHHPKEWKEAFRVLSRADVRAIPLMIGPHPDALANWKAEAVVDLSQLGLSYIKVSAEGEIRLGALTPLEDLVESFDLKEQDGGLLSTAAFQVASPGMLNLASIGGTLYEKGGPPEVVLALMVLQALVVVQGAGEARRELSITDFLESSGWDVQPKDVVVEVRIPSRARENIGWSLERVARTPRDEAIVAAAACLEANGDRIKSARLSLAGISDRPQRFRSAEEQMENQPLTEDLLQNVAATVVHQSAPIADFRGSAAYRRAMAGVLARRVLQTAWNRATTG